MPMTMHNPGRAGLVSIALGTMLVCSPAVSQAAERLTLANGFDVVCDHHALVDGRIRIYPKAMGPDYFELKPADVAAVEVVPDLPQVVEAAAEKVASVVNASSAIVPQKAKPAADTKLTAGDLHQLLSKAGSEHNVDEDLLASLVKAESNGNSHAISHAGARGLMQLMPRTAHQLGVADSFAPDQNVRGGTAYLDELLTRYHDNVALALAAYNAGPQAVDRYHGIPPYRETRAYVARVIHEFNRRVAARQRLARMAMTQTTNQAASGFHHPAASQLAASASLR